MIAIAVTILLVGRLIDEHHVQIQLLLGICALFVRFVSFCVYSFPSSFLVVYVLTVMAALTD